ncbi:MAG: hypothetical protein WC102_08275 [Saccharofermentanales bacterium]
MNTREFIEKSDKILSCMNTDELRNCLHEIARITPKSNQDGFIHLLEDRCCYTQHIDHGAKPITGRILADEIVAERINEFIDKFKKIDEGELYISAGGYEDHSEGYWDSDWIWEYEDNNGVGDIYKDAIHFAHDCVYDRRYDEAVRIYDLILETSVIVSAECGADDFVLYLDDMVKENLVRIDLDNFAREVLYANYQHSRTTEERVSVLFSCYRIDFMSDICIEEIFAVGRDELTETDEFIQAWITFLMGQKGDVAEKLLIDGCLYFGGVKRLHDVAKATYADHPTIYLTVLQEYEKVKDYENMKSAGMEALKVIRSRSGSGSGSRSKIALKTAQAAYCVGDIDLMHKYWYEAFVSNPIVPNYLRLLTDKKAAETYQSKADKIILRMNERAGPSLEHKLLCFFTGNPDQVIDWCEEHDGSLGWSGSFVYYGVHLMLLYLYQGDELGKAGQEVSYWISYLIGFNTGINRIFFSEGYIFEDDSVLEKDGSLLWNVFKVWKEGHSICSEDARKYADWLEEIVDRRIRAIVSGKFRRKYSSVALLAAAIGEVKESMWSGVTKSDVIQKYLKEFYRFSAFTKELKEHL